MKLRAITFVVLSFIFVGCQSVTISPDGRSSKVTTPPTYSKSEHFFLVGLIGKSNIDVNQVCGGRKVVQMQSQQTFVDGLLGIITLGIYAPHTAKVWCE